VNEEGMLKIAIIVRSTRPGRKSEAVAKWVYDIARQRGDAEFSLLWYFDEVPKLGANVGVSEAEKKIIKAREHA
jgi:NAD(P)H-dependent FMN reductase